jgi:hypothetical protein
MEERAHLADCTLSPPAVRWTAVRRALGCWQVDMLFQHRRENQPPSLCLHLKLGALSPSVPALYSGVCGAVFVVTAT